MPSGAFDISIVLQVEAWASQPCWHAAIGFLLDGVPFPIGRLRAARVRELQARAARVLYEVGHGIDQKSFTAHALHLRRALTEWESGVALPRIANPDPRT